MNKPYSEVQYESGASQFKSAVTADFAKALAAPGQPALPSDRFQVRPPPCRGTPPSQRAGPPTHEASRTGGGGKLSCWMRAGDGCGACSELMACECAPVTACRAQGMAGVPGHTSSAEATSAIVGV